MLCEIGRNDSDSKQNNNDIDINNENKIERVLIDEDNFVEMIEKSKKSKNSICYVGWKPHSAPEITRIDTYDSTIRVHFDANLVDTYNIFIESQSPEHKPATNRKQVTTSPVVFKNLDMDGEYSVCIQKSNVFGKSPLSEWTPYVEAKNKLHATMISDHSRIKCNNETTPVFLFGTSSPSRDSQFYLCPLGENRYISMDLVNENLHIYHASWNTGIDNNVNGVNFGKLAFRLCMIADSEMNRFYQSGRSPKIQLIKTPSDCNHIQNKDFNGWMFDKSQGVFLLDFKSYNKRTLFQNSNIQDRMKIHYGKIVRSMVSYLLKICNSGITPVDIIGIIFELHLLICNDYKIDSTFKNAIMVECVDYLQEKRIESAKNWHELAPALTSLFILTSIANKETTCINDGILSKIYEKFTQKELFGDGKNVVKQIGNLLGEYLSYFQTRFYNRIVYSAESISKLRYVLWYNLLNQQLTDSKLDQRLIVIRNSLKPTRNIGELFKLAQLDMHFDFDFDFHCIRLEYEFLDMLLYSINSIEDITEHFYDFLRQITDISTIYRITLAKKSQITLILGDSFSDWRTFITFLLSKCQVMANSDIHVCDGLMDEQKKLLTLGADMIAPQIRNICNEQDCKYLYDLLTQYTVLLNDHVRIGVLKNDFVCSKAEFVSFFCQFFRCGDFGGFVNDGYFCEKLELSRLCLRLYRLWCDHLKFRGCVNLILDYQLPLKTFELFIENARNEGILHNYCTGTLAEHLDLLIASNVDSSLKDIIISTIDGKWKQLSAEAQKETCAGCIRLVKQGLIDICDKVMQKIAWNFNPVVGDEIQSIKNLLTNSSSMFVEMLSQIRKYDKDGKLSIMDRLTNFKKFWEHLLISIGGENTRVAVVDILCCRLATGEKYFEKLEQLFKMIDGNDKKLIKEAVEVLNKYREYKTHKISLEICLNGLVRSESLISSNLWQIIENWDDLSLFTLFQLNWTQRVDNKQVFEYLAKLSKSKICISIWKSITPQRDAETRFTFENFVELGQHLIQEFEQIASQIVNNTLTIATITKSLHLLKQESVESIRQDINHNIIEKYGSTIANMDTLVIAQNIKLAFTVIDTIKNQRILRDCVTLFISIYKQNKRAIIKMGNRWETLGNAIDKQGDITAKTIESVANFYTEYKSIFFTLQPFQTEFLSLLSENAQWVGTLINKFVDDGAFVQYLELFGNADSVHQQSTSGLIIIRNMIVSKFYTNEFNTCYEMSELLVKVTNGIGHDEVAALQEVVALGCLMLDTDTEANDGNLISRLKLFYFVDEKEYFDNIACHYNKSQRNELFNYLLVGFGGKKSDIESKNDEYKNNTIITQSKNESEFTSLVYRLQEQRQDDNNKYELEELMSKLDLVKQIGKKRVLYYHQGGRIGLDKLRTIEVNDTSVKELRQMSINWDEIVNQWKKYIDELRDEYPVLSFYTVKDMIFLCDQIELYAKQGAGCKKEQVLSQIFFKLSYIDATLTISDVTRELDVWKNTNISNSDIFRRGKELHDLAILLAKSFEMRTISTITMPHFDFKLYSSGKPHMFYCEDRELVLDCVLKLFMSQNQRPCASQLLFCDKNTTLEQIECLLRRASIDQNKIYQKHHSKTKNARKSQKSSPFHLNPILHCLVQPEKLENVVQMQLVKMVPNFAFKHQCFLAVVTASRQHIIYEKLKSFLQVRLVPSKNELKTFFDTILESDLNKFHNLANKNWLCNVYVSQKECVGKSYTIRQQATRYDNHQLIRIPICHQTVDIDFIVDKLLCANTKCAQTRDSNSGDRIIYHIDVSSNAGIDVNDLMFKLLVLGYVSTTDGASFRVSSRHGFLVELPSRLFATLTSGNIRNVLRHFSFVAGNRSVGIKKYEVQDSLQQMRPIVGSNFELILNELKFTEKQQFVIKYLDALDSGALEIKGPKMGTNWQYTDSKNISKERCNQLLNKYFHRGFNSLAVVKQFLRYTYHQLLQVYTAMPLTSDWLAINIDPCSASERYIQYHRAIVSSIIESAQYIACHLYCTPQMERNDDSNDAENTIEYEFEAVGDEEFFLVKYWSLADPPMVILNQQHKYNSGYITMGSTTLANDIEESYAHSTNDFSILAFHSLAKLQHKDSKEWKLLQQLLDNGQNLKWDLYNFDNELEKMKHDAVALSKQKRSHWELNEYIEKQKHKLQMLLRICGGFTSDDPQQQDEKIESLYNDCKNRDYTLTFDNILKIVSIFLRIKSGIPLLIMGETGCGKTCLIKFMASILDIKLYTINVHFDYTVKQLEADLGIAINEAITNTKEKVVVFFDEINTSPDPQIFKEIICDHSINGEEFPENLVFIGALNPYRIAFQKKR